jgi:hypothetical protein
MERLAQLIGKLNEQFAQNADPFQLLVTAQLIETELVQMSTSTHRPVSTSKVAVVMPSSNGHAIQNRQMAEELNTQANTQQASTQTVVNGAQAVVNGTVEKNNNNGHHHQETAQIQQNGWKLDPLKEIPTLAHQQVVKELNEVMARQEPSLNDKLKEEVKEVAHVLNDAPVRDLRRAIGINDRFVFISELFRNDEVMYERSIKTINGFRILPEAQYWIERELKVKLGWDENKESTRHFYQLVKRRFS